MDIIEDIVKPWYKAQKAVKDFVFPVWKTFDKINEWKASEITTWEMIGNALSLLPFVKIWPVWPIKSAIWSQATKVLDWAKNMWTKLKDKLNIKKVMDVAEWSWAKIKNASEWILDTVKKMYHKYNPFTWEVSKSVPFKQMTIDDIGTLKNVIPDKEMSIVKALFDKFNSIKWTMPAEKFMKILTYQPKSRLSAASAAVLWQLIIRANDDWEITKEDIKAVTWSNWKTDDKGMSTSASYYWKPEYKGSTTKEDIKKTDIKNPKTWISLFKEWSFALPDWKVPSRVFSDNFWVRWTNDTRDLTDDYLTKLWVWLEWWRWTATRNVWLAHSIVVLKKDFPEEFNKLQKILQWNDEWFGW